MMLAMHGRESTTDAFLFFLAEKLGKTVAELGEMSHAEYVDWVAYWEAKRSFESVGRGG